MIVINLVIALLSGVFFDDIAVSFVATLFLLFGNVIVKYIISGDKVTTSLKIYNVCFFVYSLYAVVCSVYMYGNGFETMFVQDNITAFIPYSKDLSEKSFGEMWRLIFASEEAFAYNHCGWILIYFAYVIKFVGLLGSEIYVSLQFSMIFISCFIPVFIYKLLIENKISFSLKWTWLYAFTSILFYYATLVLRDIPIALFYCVTIFYAFKDYSKRSIAIMVLMFILTYGLRPQSAVFLLLIDAIPMLKKRMTLKRIVLLTSGCLAIFALFVWLEGFNLYNDTQETYTGILQSRQGASTLNSLNSLPPIISQIAKLIFIIISPIPSWAFMEWGDSANGLNNELGFTRAIAVLYNFIILAYTIYGIFFLNRGKLPKSIWCGLFIGIAYILAQTNSIEQRRIMACFPLLLLFAASVATRISKSQNQRVICYAIASFALIQAVGLTKYI